MKDSTKFIGVLAGTILLAIVLAPILHRFLPFPFERIFTRILKIAGLIGIVVLGGLRKTTLERFGLKWTADSSRFLRTGFAVCLSALMAFTAVQILAGNAYWSPRAMTAFTWALKILDPLAAGILIGLAEEFLFRGFLFTSLRDRVFRGTVWASMGVTSAVYALVHFISVRKPDIAAQPGLVDGLAMVLAPFRALADWPTTWPAAVGLFLFGMVLNYCAVRTGSLYPSIGLHAAAVFFIRTVRQFVVFRPTDVLVWSSYRVYDGGLGWIVLLLIGLLSSRFFTRSQPAPPAPDSGR